MILLSSFGCTIFLIACLSPLDDWIDVASLDVSFLHILGVSQQTVSKIDQSGEVDDERLKAIASALGVKPEIIRDFSEERLFNNIRHNSDTSSHNTIVNYQLNPIDKVVELYERLLKSEQEKVAMFQALLEKR